MGTLYVVATPIGNLQDITFRAVRVLKEVGLIAAEDTRKTMRLLSAYDIHTPLESYHRHSSPAKLEALLEALKTRDVAMVSEAGMPGISDPGQQLIGAAIDKGVRVVPIPGPSALTSALVVSGLPTDRFLFLGFLPRVKPDRRKLLASVASLPFTLVLFEAPHRLVASLADTQEVLGDRQAAIGREMTKLHEEVVRGRVSELIAAFRERAPKGEFTLVVGPASGEGASLTRGRDARAPGERDSTDLLEMAKALRAEGISSKEAVRRLMEAGSVGRREAYRAWLVMLQSAEHVG